MVTSAPATGALLGSVTCPAKAGIHGANLQKRAVKELDSRFGGNDQRFIPLHIHHNFRILISHS
jgi:hypothetical protein